MRFNQLTAEALQLQPKDRALLAEKIWNSLDSSILKTSSSSEEIAIELGELRDQEMNNDKSIIISHAELMNSLKI